MSEFGRVVVVDEYIPGGELAANSVAGAMTLTLNSTGDLQEPAEGRTVQVKLASPASAESEVVTVSAINDDTDQLTLSSPTSLAHPEGRRVETFPRAISRIAHVHLEDDTESAELIGCQVPHALYDKVAIGLREDGAQEAVEIEELGDRWVVVDVLAQEPEVDASFLSVDVLSAISADMGDITAGTITGSTIRTDVEPNPRIVLDSANRDRIKVFGTSGQVGSILAEAGDLKIGASNSIHLSGGRVSISGTGGQGTVPSIDLKNSGGPVPAPPAGFIRLHYRSDLVGQNEVRIRFPNGVTKTIANDG